MGRYREFGNARADNRRLACDPPCLFTTIEHREFAMPLRDHFRPPVNRHHAWDELHGGWPMKIVEAIQPLLPANFTAAPQVHLGGAVEIDVGTYETELP